MPFLQNNFVSNIAPSPLDQAATLAPGFTRTPGGSLRRNGQPADANYGTTPAFSAGPLDTSAATKADIIAKAKEAPPPSATDDPLAPVMDKIAKSESGNDPNAYTQLYGGDHFGFPQWAGKPGPAGISHAAGKYQFQPGTWVEASKEMVAQGQPVPDFRKPEDQERVARFWATKTYRDKTGRDLAADAKAGQVDYSALSGQWAGLRSPAAKEDLMGPLREAAVSIGAEMQASNKQAYERQQQLVSQYAREASEALPGSKEREEALNRQLAASEEMTKTFDEIAKHPPQYTPMDVMGRFGSIATVLAVLGGLKSRQPLTAALGAAGSAMQALNQQNYNEYKIAFDQWKTQSDLAVQSIRAHSDAIRNILDDRRLTQADRDAKLRATYSEFGMEAGLAALQQNNIQWPFQQQVELQKLSNQFELAKGNMERLNAYLQLSQDRLNKPATPKEYEITTPDGQKSTVSLMQDRQGFLTPDGQRYDVPTGASMKPIPPSLGRQAATQVARIQGAANELAGTLTNLVDLPISSTTGWLMGAQMHPPEQLGEAARRSLASHLTEDEVKSLLYSSQGVPRFLAQLESLGAATGLVGLSNQARMALPASGDDGYEVLRKYAELRQIVDRSLETAKTLPGVSDAQKTQFDQIAEEVHAAVPWTVKDINALQHNPSDESVAEFARRVNAAGASGGANYAAPDDVYKAFDAGKLTAEQAKKILIDRFGAKTQ